MLCLRSATEATICAGNTAISLHDRMYRAQLWCEADTSLKTFRNFQTFMYLEGVFTCTYRVHNSSPLVAMMNQANDLHTPTIRGALIFSSSPITVVDVPLRHCDQDTCLSSSLRTLHASSITATSIRYLNNMRWEEKFMNLILLQLSTPLRSSATETDIFGELESLSYSRQSLPVRKASRCSHRWYWPLRKCNASE